jgi:hypothetical protein
VFGLSAILLGGAILLAVTLLRSPSRPERAPATASVPA